MINVGDIMSGWSNYLFPNAEIKKMAQERAKICAACPDSKMQLTVVGDKKMPYPHCTICGCFIPAKVSSTKTKGCPKKLWK